MKSIYNKSKRVTVSVSVGLSLVASPEDRGMPLFYLVKNNAHGLSLQAVNFKAKALSRVSNGYLQMYRVATMC